MAELEVIAALPSANPTNGNKRPLADLAESLLVDAPQKKRAKSEKPSESAAYELVGRKLVCLANQFIAPNIALKTGILGMKNREEEMNLAENLEQHMNFYHMMLIYSPGLEDDLRIPGRLDALQLNNICAWIATGMREQRSTDLGAIKHAALTYLMPNHEPLDPPLVQKEDKSGRGFNHPQIAQFLCPRNKLVSFDEDPDIIIAALQEEKIRATAANWPTLFYKEGVYDPEDRLKGLFCGQAAFRVYTHLFIGPAAAATDTVVGNPSRPSKNRLWNLTKVTPEIIAYVHVLLYFTLSTAPRWTADLGAMDLEDLHSLILEMFADTDAWTRETLEWWNRQAFPKKLANEDPDEENDIAIIRAKRAGRNIQPRRVRETTIFATPPPEQPVPVAAHIPLESGIPIAGASAMFTASPSTTTSNPSDSTDNFFSSRATPGEQSDLSSIPLDNEQGGPVNIQAGSLVKVSDPGANSTEATTTTTCTSTKKGKKKATQPKKSRARKNGF